MEDRRVAVSEEVVEPELLSPGSSGPRTSESRQAPPPLQKPGILSSLKSLLAGGLALIGAALLLAGAFLTSTVIGAIIGIPLMLLGAAAFYLLFKLIASGANNTFIFRRF